ncbi:MAG: lipocalin-like domain-containing protein [Bacteroidaceae bacterium]|nr:lipocalin-like domain-containing protein [Bacteroidaceae bacterium]
MQKKIIYSLLASLLFIFASCTLETSGNADFDGAWHLVRVNDSIPEQTNIYWNVQGKMLLLQDKDYENNYYILRFERDNNKLQLSSPHVAFDYQDVPLEDLTQLVLFGIDDISAPFTIEHLDGSRMTLKSATKKLEFRQF